MIYKKCLCKIFTKIVKFVAEDIYFRKSVLELLIRLINLEHKKASCFDTKN